MARGGRRTPSKPAPVSGPSALARRTDGGAGQPIRAAAGGTPGVENPNLPALQEAAPLAAGGLPPRNPSHPPSAANPFLDVFRPSDRPQEDPAAGVQGEPQILNRDPDALLRILYSKFPHPDIARLINPSAGP